MGRPAPSDEGGADLVDVVGVVRLWWEGKREGKSKPEPCGLFWSQKSQELDRPQAPCGSEVAVVAT